MGRSIKKGPFVQAALLKHVEAMNASGKKQVIKTLSLIHISEPTRH